MWLHSPVAAAAIAAAAVQCSQQPSGVARAKDEMQLAFQQNNWPVLPEAPAWTWKAVRLYGESM